MSMVPCYVGLDYHDDTIRVCAIAEDKTVLLNRNVPNDPSWVMLTVGRVSDHVLGVAIEACCGAADFASRLQSLTGWPVKMAHAGGVACLKKTRDKTDAGDAWHLADLIRADFLPKVWLADEQTRQLRRLVSHRNAVVAERKNVKLRIRAVAGRTNCFHGTTVDQGLDAMVAHVSDERRISLGARPGDPATDPTRGGRAASGTTLCSSDSRRCHRRKAARSTRRRPGDGAGSAGGDRSLRPFSSGEATVELLRHRSLQRLQWKVARPTRG